MVVRLDRVEGEGRLRVPPPADLHLAKRFRSTWLTSSIKALRDRGLWDAYLMSLPQEHHETVEHLIAGVWLDVDIAHAHYRATDSLGLTEQELYAIGLEVTERVHGSLLSVVVRSAKAVGADPWMVFDRTSRMWNRVWDGGGVLVRELGPKEAFLQFIEWPIAAYDYIRVAMRGVISGLLQLFCRRVFVREERSMGSSQTVGFRISWV